MSKNINFIPATDLPVAEGDEVSVLCLENGAMKQKPASGLGGGGGYDAVIKFTRDPDNEWDTLTLESGDYAAVYAKIMDGEFPSVLLTTTDLSGDSAGMTGCMKAFMAAYFPDGIISLSFFDGVILLDPNGEVSFA